MEENRIKQYHQANMSNPRVFRDIIETYECARPGYPAGLFQDIVSFAKLKPNANVLEIGAGPGQATDFFVKNGSRITALEISEPQVRHLRQKYASYPNFSAVCSKFEDYTGIGDLFGLIFSATAFHWIAPETGYPRAYAMLKPGGVMAVFWHLASIVEPHTDMLCEIREICRNYAPELDDYISEDEAEKLHRQRIEQMQTNGLFRDPSVRIYNWEDSYSAERYLLLMRSYSDFYEISPAKQRKILRSVAQYLQSKGGTIIIPQEVRLYMAKKLP